VIQRDKYGKNQHGFNENFLDFAKTYKFILKNMKNPTEHKQKVK
jgi:hypothetical protein